MPDGVNGVMSAGTTFYTVVSRQTRKRKRDSAGPNIPKG
jgi:hypothetical protein